MANTRKLLVFTSRKKHNTPAAFLYQNTAWLGVIGSLIAIIAVVGWNYSTYSKAPPSYTIITTQPGAFGNVSVVRDVKYGTSVIMLIYGRSIIGGYWEAAGNPSLFIAFELMSLVLYAHPAPKRALVIGLGTGIFTSRANQFGVISDVVEIDPLVVTFAQKYFGFSTNGKIYTEDALSFNAENSDSHLYDIVVHDIFSGDISTSHYTLNILQKYESMLTGDGIFVLNYLGKPKNIATKYILSTLQHIWPYVRCFVDVEVTSNEIGNKLLNMVFFASRNPINIATSNEKVENAQKFSAGWILNNYPRLELTFPKLSTNEDVLTDENHEILKWQEEEKKEYAKTMLEFFDEKAWKDILSSKP